MYDFIKMTDFLDKEYLLQFWKDRVKEMPKHTEYKKDENDSTSIGLDTDSKTIIGAINELKGGKQETLKTLYGGNITVDELKELDAKDLQPGEFYSVYKEVNDNVYEGNFTIIVDESTNDERVLLAGSFLKWNGEKWIYDESLVNSEFKSNCIYQRSFAFYESANSNVYADDTWICIWEWETVSDSAEKCGISFLCKDTCSDIHKGYVTRFTIDSRSTNRTGLPYSYIDCEYLVPQTFSNASYWGMNPLDLRTFFRTTVTGNTYRLYAHVHPDMNGFSGVDFIYPAWSVKDDGFKNPIPINKDSIIKWEDHLGEEILKVNYAQMNTGNSTSGADVFIDFATTDNDDAAKTILGDNWRMPTPVDFQELLDNCDYEFLTYEDEILVYSLKLTSKNNGNSIYLRKSGIKNDEDGSWVNSNGFYWSSVTPLYGKASILYFSYDRNADYTDAFTEDAFIDRYIGANIRPVTNTAIEGMTVDLGLPSGLLWAVSNLTTTGLAENPTDDGDFFAWGETTTKDTFTWDNYKFGTLGNFTKYNATDQLTTLENNGNVTETIKASIYHNADGSVKYLIDENNRTIIPPSMSFEEWVDNSDNGFTYTYSEDDSGE